MLDLLLLGEGRPLAAAIGIGRARQNRVPRWLVEIRRLGKFFYLSDVPGQLVGVQWVFGIPPFGDGLDDLDAITWDQGVVDVQVSPYEIELESMSLPLAAATVHLTPDMRRFFDPMPDLHRMMVRVSMYDGRFVRSIVRGLVDDSEIGFDGELVTFRVVEKWRSNPDFPPAILERDVRVSSARLVEGSEDKAYPYAFGDAKAVPALEVRSWGDGGEEQIRMMYLGTGLHPAAATDADPCPYTRFPFNGHPDVGQLRAWSMKGLWYGRNPCIRDDCEGDEQDGWETVEGEFSRPGGTTELESTDADSTRVWTLWNYEETLSIAVRAELVGAGAIHCFYWAYLDAENHVRVEFPFGGTEIRLVVMQNGAETVDESREIEGGLPSDEAIFQLNVDTGRLTCGVLEKGSGVEATEVDFGSVAPAVSGRIAYGSKDGTIRWHQLRQPSMRSHGATETDPNGGIRHFDDLLKHSYVGEGFKDQLGQPLFADFRRADGVLNAGNLVVLRLLRDYSGVEESFIDVPTTERLRRDLRRFRVGGYFNDVQPIFDLVNGRLAKQFMFVLSQEAGKVRGFQFDPTLLPERQLIFGVDLLELAEPIREYEKFTRFKVRYKFNAARERWNKKEKLVPDNFTYLKALESRVGKNPFPRVDLPDVADDGTANHILLMLAIIFHAGQRAVYLQRATDGADIQLGEVVELYDPARRWTDKRAFFVGREIVDQQYVRNVFRTIEFFEEAGQSGALVGEVPPPEPPVEDPTPFPTGSCWAVEESGGVITEITDFDGDPVDALAVSGPTNGSLFQDCDCGTELVGDGSEVFQIIAHAKQANGTGGFPTFGFTLQARFYSGPTCGTFISSQSFAGGGSFGSDGQTVLWCLRTIQFSPPVGATKMRILFGVTNPNIGPHSGATAYALDYEVLTSGFVADGVFAGATVGDLPAGC